MKKALKRVSLTNTYQINIGELYKWTKVKIKSGACCVLPDTELVWPEIQADHQEKKRKCPEKKMSCKGWLIATHPHFIVYSSHKRKTEGNKIYLVKFKVNPHFFHSLLVIQAISNRNYRWGLLSFSCEESLLLCLCSGSSCISSLLNQTCLSTLTSVWLLFWIPSCRKPRTLTAQSSRPH